MPYEWIRHEPTGLKPAELHLWPYRSLPRKGFVFFIAVTAALLTLPLMAALGTLVFWGLLPFLLAAVWGLWHALSRSYRQGETSEVLRLWPDRIEVSRRTPDGSEKHWHANPHWVQVNLYRTEGPVEDYLTLKAEGREVELGAFLSPEERRSIAETLKAAISR